MNAGAKQSPQDLSDILTERGLQLIVHTLPGTPLVGKKSDLNVLIMDRFWLLQYAQPASDLEIALFKHLKEMDEDYGDKITREDLEEQINEKDKELETALGQVDELKEQIVELEARLVGELV